MRLFVLRQKFASAFYSISAGVVTTGWGGTRISDLQPTPPAVAPNGETLEAGIVLILGAALIVIVIYGATAWRRIKS